VAQESNRRLPLEELEACADDFDRSVDRQLDIDRFCSRTEWILPFHRAFAPERELFVYREGDAFAAFACRSQPEGGPVLEAVENLWCFACPLVGRDSLALLEAAIADLAARTGGKRAPVVLSGIPASRDRQSLLAALVAALGKRYELHAIDSTRRFVASLEGGVDGWLGRRSSSFRRNLRAAVRRGREEDVCFESLRVQSDADTRAAYRRVLDVETKSWKAAEGAGVDHGPMLAVYADKLPRGAPRRGRPRIGAQRDGRDVGYVHGAVVGDRFRGLQMSSDRRLAHLSLGNLLQREMIERLCEEGIRSYDLGTRSEYKRRWAEEGLETLTIVARPT
jgi:hypothetical protein